MSASKRQMPGLAAPSHSDRADAGDADAEHRPGRNLRYGGVYRIEPDAESGREPRIVDILERQNVSPRVQCELKVGIGMIEPVGGERIRVRAKVVDEGCRVERESRLVSYAVEFRRIDVAGVISVGQRKITFVAGWNDQGDWRIYARGVEKVGLIELPAGVGHKRDAREGR